MNGRRRELDWDMNPLSVLARWPAGRRVLMLHSGRFDARWARRTIVAEPVGFYRFAATATGHASQWDGPWNDAPAGTLRDKPFTDLRSMLSAGAADGLWIGYLSYDVARWIEALPSRAVDDRGWPIIELGYCPGYLVYDGASERWYAHGSYARGDVLPLMPHDDPDPTFDAGTPCSVFERGEYETAVGRVLDYIAAGDVFQVNLSQRFTAPFHGDYPRAQRAFYRQLAAASPAWYGAYLELGDRRVIASTSPELFLGVDETGHVTTRPIKGTRPASVHADVLRRSGKDTAELNMIVDLMRNDLGRVCSYGSIKVPSSRVIESHPTIHHGVATVTGRLHHGKDLVHLLRATLPGGSVTGAPKVRAMQIIDELEPVRRGPYCGCIGLLSPTSCCLNIAIRTVLLDADHQRADFCVGGGIVADSDPAAEYDETMDKAAAMLEALGAGRGARKWQSEQSTSGNDLEEVQQQSPGSRSAPWD